MRVLLGELMSSAHVCALDSAVISAKMRLDALASTMMRSASPTEFVALRDELSTLMLDLPLEQRHTSAQIFHLYDSVIARLNVPFISFQAKNLLSIETKRDFDHESYADAITQVLSEQLLENRQRAHANKFVSKGIGPRRRVHRR